MTNGIDLRIFPQLFKEDFPMLHVVTTGAYYPSVVTTWKIGCHGKQTSILGRKVPGP